METQDQRKLNQSGGVSGSLVFSHFSVKKKRINRLGPEGHSGVHVCHKCGWPFPNSHPSARHRRAHKKVCGTVEGYKLDGSQDKPHLEGSDGEHVSNDDHKSIGEKAIERTVSRKSSSGVGSRSGRSTRSEDEMFTDAVTEFSDSTGSEVTSDGVMSRRNSLQSKTERGLERFKSSLETFGDESSVSSIILEDKQLEAVQTSEAKTKEIQVGIPSQDETSNSVHDPSPISVSVTGENENPVEQNLKQSSETFNGLDTAHEDHQESAKSDNLSELRSPSSTEAAKDVSEQVSAAIGINEELTNSIPAGGEVKLTEMQTTVSDDKLECSETIDSPGNYHHSLNLVEEVESADTNVSKSLDMVEVSDLKTEANENADVPDVSDDLLVQEHVEIAPEDIHHKSGTCSDSTAAEAPSAVESSVDLLKPVAEQIKPVGEEKTVGGLDQTSVLNASCGDSNGLQSEEIRDEAWEDELGSFEPHKSSVSSEKVFPEVDTTDDDHGQETALNDDEEHLVMHESVIDTVKDGEEHIAMYENDKSKVPAGELSVSSSILAECSVDDTLPQAKKLMVDSDVGNVEKISTNVLLVGQEDENEPLSAEPSPGYGSIVTASNDDNEEPNEPVITHKHGNLEKIMDSGNSIPSYSQPENELASEDVREAQHASNIGGGEHMDRVDTGPVEKTDESFDDSILKMSKDDASLASSGTANVGMGSCTEKIEHAASNTESEKVTEQHSPVSEMDFTKPSGQNESQESNSRHASMPSAVSDTFSVDTAALNLSQASAEPEAVSLKAEVMEEVQYLESKPSTQLQEPEKPDNTSEIETFENQKQTALKTLLGEAIAKSRAESPTYNENQPKNPNPETSKEEVAREWDSPARYPVKIKTEKRRAKSKSSFWVPFLCCSSSVNASGP